MATTKQGRSPAEVFAAAMKSADMTPAEKAAHYSRVAAVFHDDERKRAAAQPQTELRLAA